MYSTNIKFIIEISTDFLTMLFLSGKENHTSFVSLNPWKQNYVCKLLDMITFKILIILVQQKRAAWIIRSMRLGW